MVDNSICCNNNDKCVSIISSPDISWGYFFDLDDSCPTIHSVQDVPQFFLNKLCHNSFVIKFAIVD